MIQRRQSRHFAVLQCSGYLGRSGYAVPPPLTVLEGFPNEKCNLPLELRPFWQVRSQLSLDDAEGLILVGPRVVIPASLRQEIIRRLLQMHQGATKLRQRARPSLYSSISAHTAVVIF